MLTQEPRRTSSMPTSTAHPPKKSSPTKRNARKGLPAKSAPGFRSLVPRYEAANAPGHQASGTIVHLGIGMVKFRQHQRGHRRA